jgi:RNA polymerase sigma-70 factor (ECF subfamily)
MVAIFQQAAAPGLRRTRDADMKSSAPAPAIPHDASSRDEAEIIGAVRAGDSRAFDELVGRYMRRAFAVAYRLLGQRQDAEDVVQDAFLAALIKIETFDRRRPFGPWLLRIVVNRAINMRKARTLRHAEPIPETATSGGESPAEAAERSERRDALQRALAQLPDQQRWIVELFEIDGFTGPEIADMFDLADGTVRWHLHAARQTLRTALGPFATRTS